MGEPYLFPLSHSSNTPSPPSSPTREPLSSQEDTASVSEVSATVFSSSSSSSSAPTSSIETAMPLPDVSIVERLTGYIGGLVDTPSSMRTSEKLPFIQSFIELGLTRFPPSPTSEGRSDEELTKDLLFKAFRDGWGMIKESFANPSTTAVEASTQRFFQSIQGPVDAYFSGETDLPNVMEQVKQTIPSDGLDTILQEKLDAINHADGTHYRSLAEAGKHQHRTMIRKVIAKQMREGTPHVPDFLRKTQELLGRISSFSTFAECVVEDVLAGNTKKSSPILQLLDMFIIDFIQADRKSVWFQSVENNFGYRRSEESWRNIIGKGSIQREAAKMLMNMFEHSLDLFNGTVEGEPPIPSAVLDIIDHLDWILAAPLEEIYSQVPKREEEAICRYNRTQRVFQESFIRWAIEKVRNTHPELVDNQLLKELNLRLQMASFISSDTISLTHPSEKHLALADAIKPLIARGVEAARFAAGHLIASRDPAGPNLDLVFGFGFQGYLFSDQPNARNQPNAILLNVSERGRRLPEKPQEVPRSLFSLPFLYAAQLLLQIAHQEVEQLPTPKDVLPLIILGEPTEEDKRVHRYLFEQMITHTFTHPDIQLNPRFLDKGARGEIVHVLASYAEKSSLKGLSPSDREAERARLSTYATEIGQKIVDPSNPRLTMDQLLFLQRALANKSSICVESVISRHSKNDLIVPLSFDPQRHDVISIKGKPVKIGARGVIPPCDRYCQLFSGSHQLWADLNRNPTMDQLDQRLKESGGSGLQSTADASSVPSSSS